MTPAIHGIHHLTAIARDPQANLEFYTRVLGLRLVKKTVNFDDPTAYHLYYGDATGSPGSIVTFFTWPEGVSAGRTGTGQVARVSFSAAPEALPFWQKRLSALGMASSATERFGEEVLAFSDPDGITVEIVGVTQDARAGWLVRDIPTPYSLRGLHTAELVVSAAPATEALITRDMGYRLVQRRGPRARFETGHGGSGAYIDVVAAPADAPRGLGGIGTIHHIAWRVPTDATQVGMQRRLNQGGLQVSPVRDRNYFRSIYFRDPSGVLFEIATDEPGFGVDEPLSALGTGLKLPAELERAREQIEKRLPPLRDPARAGSATPSIVSTHKHTYHEYTHQDRLS